MDLVVPSLLEWYRTAAVPHMFREYPSHPSAQAAQADLALRIQRAAEGRPFRSIDLKQLTVALLYAPDLYSFLGHLDAYKAADGLLLLGAHCSCSQFQLQAFSATVASIMEWGLALLEGYGVFVLSLGPRNPQAVHLLSAHIHQRAKLAKEAPKDSTDGTGATDMITASQHPNFAKVVYGPVLVRLKALVASWLGGPSASPLVTLQILFGSELVVVVRSLLHSLNKVTTEKDFFTDIQGVTDAMPSHLGRFVALAYPSGTPGEVHPELQLFSLEAKHVSLIEDSALCFCNFSLIFINFYIFLLIFDYFSLILLVLVFLFSFIYSRCIFLFVYYLHQLCTVVSRGRTKATPHHLT